MAAIYNFQQKFLIFFWHKFNMTLCLRFHFAYWQYKVARFWPLLTWKLNDFKKHRGYQTTFSKKKKLRLLDLSQFVNIQYSNIWDEFKIQMFLKHCLQTFNILIFCSLTSTLLESKRLIIKSKSPRQDTPNCGVESAHFLCNASTVCKPWSLLHV